MHQKITDMAAAYSESIPWLRPAIDQVRKNEYAPIGDRPGTHTSDDLRRELLVRSGHARKVNLTVFGIEELISHLATRPPQDTIRNFGFSNHKKRKFLTIYFDDDGVVVGAILIIHSIYQIFSKRIRDRIDQFRLDLKPFIP